MTASEGAVPINRLTLYLMLNIFGFYNAWPCYIMTTIKAGIPLSRLALDFALNTSKFYNALPCCRKNTA